MGAVNRLNRWKTLKNDNESKPKIQPDDGIDRDAIATQFPLLSDCSGLCSEPACALPHVVVQGDYQADLRSGQFRRGRRERDPMGEG
jgi:hypothetical protein